MFAHKTLVDIPCLSFVEFQTVFLINILIQMAEQVKELVNDGEKCIREGEIDNGELILLNTLLIIY